LPRISWQTFFVGPPAFIPLNVTISWTIQAAGRRLFGWRGLVIWLGNRTWRRNDGPHGNPIENCFSKIKAHLRKAAERTINRLCRRIAKIVSSCPRHGPTPVRLPAVA
jgi:hypothetical protein